MLYLGLFWCLISFPMTGGDDRPVCVVKRFRKSPPEPEHSVTSVELQTSQSAVSPSVQRLDASTPEALESDAWSVISPVDLLGVGQDAESVDSSPFDSSQPRWNAWGEYDFGYQPGNPLDVRLSSRKPPFGQSESHKWAPPQLKTRQFHDPGFGTVPAWRPPAMERKSKVHL